MEDEGTAGAGCFANPDLRCSRDNWGDCDSSLKHSDVWVLLTCILVWLGCGLTAIVRETRRDAAAWATDHLHDVVAQGVTVGESSRSMGKNKLVRYMKIGAIWLEWPVLTLTPMVTLCQRVGVDIKDAPVLDFSFHGFTEAMLVILAMLQVGTLIVLKFTKSITLQNKVFQTLYPLLYDLMFLGLTMSLMRIGLCISGAQHFTLTDGSNCECLDRYLYFAIPGTACFSALYVGALTYKADFEHLYGTKELQFQTSFQITMVITEACKYFSSWHSIGAPDFLGSQRHLFGRFDNVGPFGFRARHGDLGLRGLSWLFVGIHLQNSTGKWRCSPSRRTRGLTSCSFVVCREWVDSKQHSGRGLCQFLVRRDGVDARPEDRLIIISGK